MMEIALGSEHAGYRLKGRIRELVTSLGHTCKDYGAYDESPNDDYPLLAREIGEAVSRGEQQRGILVCGTGQGMCISANKVPGVRATPCNDLFSARAGREHNDGQHPGAGLTDCGGRAGGRYRQSVAVRQVRRRPPRQEALLDMPMPFAPKGEDFVVPSEERIYRELKEVMA